MQMCKHFAALEYLQFICLCSVCGGVSEQCYCPPPDYPGPDPAWAGQQYWHQDTGADSYIRQFEEAYR